MDKTNKIMNNAIEALDIFIKTKEVFDIGILQVDHTDKTFKNDDAKYFQWKISGIFLDDGVAFDLGDNLHDCPSYILSDSLKYFKRIDTRSEKDKNDTEIAEWLFNTIKYRKRFTLHKLSGIYIDMNPFDNDKEIYIEQSTFQYGILERFMKECKRQNVKK